MLDEQVPNDSEISTIFQIIELGCMRVSSTYKSSSDLLNAPRTQSKKTCDIMRFYHQLVMAAFTKGNTRSGRTRGLLCAYYISRWISFCINNKAVCRHTPLCLVWYSGLLIHGFSERNCHEAHRLGKIALKILNESEHQNEVAGT